MSVYTFSVLELLALLESDYVNASEKSEIKEELKKRIRK